MDGDQYVKCEPALGINRSNNVLKISIAMSGLLMKIVEILLVDHLTLSVLHSSRLVVAPDSTLNIHMT